MSSVPNQFLDIVTGGAGFIGSHLTEHLLDHGRSVRVVDNFSSGNPANLAHLEGRGELEILNIDIADTRALKDVFHGASRVFHLAALADIVPSIQDPENYFRSNVDGTYSVVEAARATKIERFIYTASSSCYGVPETFPTSETARIDNRYPYALTKFLGEQIVMHWADVYDLPAVSLRLFNVYGPRARTSGTYGAVFGVFLSQIIAEKPVTIVGSGEQTRDFTYVSDVVEAFRCAADSKLCGKILNVGSGKPQSINRLVDLLGVKNKTHIPKRPGEPDATHADIAQIAELLGWSPSVSFEEGVRKMLENIEYWQDAPVWTPESIGEATKDWFHYLKD
ncbi:MAG: SDR family oxidoreductase [Rhodospirillaceae bacterium]